MFKAEINKLKRGEFIQLYCIESCITLTIWQDTKSVHLLDNCCNPYRACYVRRMTKKGKEKKYYLPFVSRVYNKHMGEIDSSSAHKNNYGIDLKHFRNHNRLFWSLFDSYCFVNPAILLADIYDEKHVQHMRCRQQLVNHWIGKHRKYMFDNGYKRKPRPKTIEAVINSTMSICEDSIATHQLRKYIEGTKVYCFKCKTHTTRYVCDTCIPRNLGFCNGHTNGGRDCFGDFHKKYFPIHNYLNNCR